MSEGIICRCGDDGHDYDERSLSGELGIWSRCRSYAAPEDTEWFLCPSCTEQEHEPLDGRADEIDFVLLKAPVDGGPYMSEEGDGPEMFYPRSVWTFQKAFADAAGMARLSDCVARYRGKGEFWIDDDSDRPKIVDVPGYHFEAVGRGES